MTEPGKVEEKNLCGTLLLHPFLPAFHQLFWRLNGHDWFKDEEGKEKREKRGKVKGKERREWTEAGGEVREKKDKNKQKNGRVRYIKEERKDTWFSSEQPPPSHTHTHTLFLLRFFLL